MVIPDTWVLKLSKVRILFESIQESKTIINFLTTPKDSLFPYPSSLNFSILRNYFVVWKNLLSFHYLKINIIFLSTLQR